jgi:hypothetical protein
MDGETTLKTAGRSLLLLSNDSVRLRKKLKRRRVIFR